MISLKYDWEHQYLAAILEENDARLAGRISAAELAIANRMDVLNLDHEERKRSNSRLQLL